MDSKFKTEPSVAESASISEPTVIEQEVVTEKKVAAEEEEAADLKYESEEASEANYLDEVPAVLSEESEDSIVVHDVTDEHIEEKVPAAHGNLRSDDTITSEDESLYINDEM